MRALCTGARKPCRADARSWRVAVALALCAMIAAGWLTAAAPVALAARGAHKKPSHPPAPRLPFAYDLVTALGNVYNFGGAGWYGNESSRHLVAPIVAMAVTRDGRGYWLVGANGSVFNLGDAHWYGSLASDVLGPGQQIISIVATSDSKGYWLINQSGAVISFGDAPRINDGKPLPASDLSTPIASAAIAPGGHGAWFTDSAGHVYTSGAARWFGSRVNKQSYPITSIAAFASGQGYWLADSAGQVWSFSGRVSSGAPSPTKPAPATSRAAGVSAAGRGAAFAKSHLLTTQRAESQAITGTAVSMTPSRMGNGYWVTTSSGSVMSGGSLATLKGASPNADLAAIVDIATAPTVEPPPPPSGAMGYDINWPQCASPGSSSAGALPGPPANPAGTSSYSIAVVGVDGWAVNDYNSCLSDEVAWAQRAVYPAGSALSGNPPYDLYMFLNSPSPNSPIDLTGPGGSCANLSGGAAKTCLAYNYGFNSAIAAVSYASAQGAHADVWWLDIENDTCAPGMWNNEGNGEWWSCDLALNAETIQGALDALRSLNITPGIYCTNLQWKGITGGYLPTGGAPLIWIAGAIWTSPPYPQSDGFAGPAANTKYCTDSQYWFAGGKPVMLQETPGSTGYPYDPDIAC